MGKVFGALRPCLSPYRDERQMNLSYMVLLDMWNKLGKNSSVSSEPSRLGGCNKATYS